VRRAKLSDEARQAVWKYDWSTVARDVLRVYETVAASTAGVEEDDTP
jgi:phosphatidyl-myo-inositol alpha-mannosyltransferase